MADGYISDDAPGQESARTVARVALGDEQARPPAEWVIGQIDYRTSGASPGRTPRTRRWPAAAIIVVELVTMGSAIGAPLRRREDPRLGQGHGCYVGEAVAVVVATDPYRAADAADAVEVEYAPLPVVEDPERALDDGAPLVYPDVPGNVAVRVHRSSGEVAPAFEAADVVLRERFTTARAAGAAIEPRAVAAQPEDGAFAVTLWDATQAPHGVRRGVAAALGLPEERVRVVVPDVGGGFGPKGRLYPEEVVVAALALRLGRPVL